MKCLVFYYYNELLESIWLAANRQSRYVINQFAKAVYWLRASSSIYLLTFIISKKELKLLLDFWSFRNNFSSCTNSVEFVEPKGLLSFANHQVPGLPFFIFFSEDFLYNLSKMSDNCVNFYDTRFCSLLTNCQIVRCQKFYSNFLMGIQSPCTLFMN